MPYNVEPHVAHEILQQLVNEQSSHLVLLFQAQVATVSKKNTTITSMTTSDGLYSKFLNFSKVFNLKEGC